MIAWPRHNLPVWFLLGLVVRFATPVMRWFCVLMFFGGAVLAGIGATNVISDHVRTPAGSVRIESTVADTESGACQVDFTFHDAPESQWIYCKPDVRRGNRMTLLFYPDERSRSEAAAPLAIRALIVAIVGGLLAIALGFMFLRMGDDGFDRYAKARLGRVN